MKNHRFLWLRNRTTNNRKCEKARNIKEKRTIEMFNTVSKQLVALRSSARDNLLFKPYQNGSKRGCLKMIFHNRMRQSLFSSSHQEKRRILRQKQYTKSEGVVFVPLIWCTVVFFICYAASKANR